MSKYELLWTNFVFLGIDIGPPEELEKIFDFSKFGLIKYSKGSDDKEYLCENKPRSLRLRYDQPFHTLDIDVVKAYDNRSCSDILLIAVDMISSMTKSVDNFTYSEFGINFKFFTDCNFSDQDLLPKFVQSNLLPEEPIALETTFKLQNKGMFKRNFRININTFNAFSKDPSTEIQGSSIIGNYEASFIHPESVLENVKQSVEMYNDAESIVGCLINVNRG